MIYSETNYWINTVSKNEFIFIYLTCDPLREIQAKVSKSNYEKTSINIWFLPSISL